MRSSPRRLRRSRSIWTARRAAVLLRRARAGETAGARRRRRLAAAAAAQAAEFEPLLATEPRRDLALTVFPLVAYKAAAVANGNKLMSSLDATNRAGLCRRHLLLYLTFY